MKKLFVALGLVMGGLHISYAEPASAQQVRDIIINLVIIA
jgi:hypothetical protein